MTRTHFHPFIRIIHWAMAPLVLAMLFVGVGMVSTTGPAYPLLLSVHRPIGFAILVLATIRLAVRVTTGSPSLPDDLPPTQRLAARFSHVLLYGSMLSMPLIGWAMLSAGGYPVVVTNGLLLPPILPHDLQLFHLLRELHTVVATAFFSLILVHLAAALIHGLIRRDGVLEGMTFRRPKPEALVEHPLLVQPPTTDSEPA